MWIKFNQPHKVCVCRSVILKGPHGTMGVQQSNTPPHGAEQSVWESITPTHRDVRPDCPDLRGHSKAGESIT